jgi:hypothetical protein
MKGVSTAVRQQTTALERPGRQRLLVERAPDASVLRICGADGRVTLSIEVTESGPVLCFEGGLEVRAKGELDFEAQRVAIRGREGVRIESGGDAHIRAQGDLNSEGREQNVRARLGNVNVKANDDVKLRGERIRLNC